MFGLFKPYRTSGLAKEAAVALERRVLCFCPDIASPEHAVPGDLNDVMEIKVFRSKARKRIEPEVKTLQSTGAPPSIDRQKSPMQQRAGGIK